MNSTRVVNLRKENFTYFIGRPSPFGNPFTHLKNIYGTIQVSSREEAIKRYEEYIRKDEYLLSLLPELVGHTLGCYCKPLACHGDVLIKLLKEKGLEQ